ncbi:MAG TPA: GH3 auxin-responsive promoter family protein, partial [Spirochaetota bacterium]|nr:GH3 auxin-responsive promoter family protein [Spirochaetota bacterium]
LNEPNLFLSSHYWSISPKNDCEITKSKIKVGFDSDSSYLGLLGEFISKNLFAVPEIFKSIRDIDDFEYLTLLFLVKNKHLGLISIWSPTFLTVLLSSLVKHYSQIIDDIENGEYKNDDMDRALLLKINTYLKKDKKRAEYLKTIDITKKSNTEKIWQNLKIISVWDDGSSKLFIKDLKEYFPNILIEGKGLLSTECVVSIPFGKSRVKTIAVNSHYFEFIDESNDSIKNLWEIEIGKRYIVVVTTSGGLYRYNTNDIVEVTDFYNKIPVIKFISRTNDVTDLVGEKLNVEFVADIINKIEIKYNIKFNFKLLFPVKSESFLSYCFAADFNKSDLITNIQKDFENFLRENFHYNYAREIKQLENLKMFIIDNDNGQKKYYNYLLKKGMTPGNIKNTVLSKEFNLHNNFDGRFYE